MDTPYYTPYHTMFEHLTLAQRSELWFALPLVGVLPLVLSLFGMPWDEGVLVFGICAVPLAYLARVCWTALTRGPEVRTLLEGLGAEPPAVTTLFFATYSWWGLLPVLFAGLLAWIAARRTAGARGFVLFFLAVSLAALVLEAWATVAVHAPMFDLINKIG